ncbi:ClpP/crotonase-like domain-containing protein [Armillaria novae-zelandiae]|uniref:ClpP/crotonase-like domain-containing protein n=1 Tax=Armillaria novae-zelandiae TaxID=153914 RepID=A0AA39PKW8_9AGAR|nr:ClpP/crotonase-like domain-containing protein [Armillaria novae-zelandiae]
MTYPLSLPAHGPLITLTHPNEWLWIIELHHSNDNRLTLEMVDYGIKPALDAVERDWRAQWRTAQQNKDTEGAKGALIFVGARNQDKFFSNGLDYPSVVANLNFFPVTYNPLLARLLTFPIPTITAINGHCFAGSMMLALACDYRVMTDGSQRRAWMCMNEVLFGAIWPLSFAAILRAKIGDARLHRKIALEGHKFTPKEALEAGLVDHIVAGNTADVLAKAEEVARTNSVNARHGVWGLIKADLYRDTLEMMQQHSRPMNPRLDDAAARSRL